MARVSIVVETDNPLNLSDELSIALTHREGFTIVTSGSSFVVECVSVKRIEA